MSGWELRRRNLVVIATAVFAVLVAQIATAGGAPSADDPEATASAVGKKKFKKFKKKTNRKINALQDQLEALTRQPGPPGPQGAAGTAPACQGNGSGDAMVAAGSVCIDRYEVSVWSSPTGGTQYGANVDDYPCNDNGQDCTNIYARSVPGVTPSTFISYFQAQQALANVGKRLPSNAEWQQAIAGTPDTTACNVSTGLVASTGANAGCISNHGANDMVGNLYEWVGDWDEQGQGCVITWPAAYGTDEACVGRAAGEASNRFPGALIRGGSFSGGTGAGPFAVFGDVRPDEEGNNIIGFRGAR